MSEALVLGIDVGTQGARVVAVDSAGDVLATSSQAFALQVHPDGAHEQDPELWWSAVRTCTAEVVAQVRPQQIGALSVTATSGTLVLTDADLVPLRPAVMWNDKRAQTQAAELSRALDDPAIRPGFTAAKALWVRAREPELWSRVRWVLSAGDWLLARLTLSGTTPVTDYTNGLKLGLDLETLAWPTILSDLGLAPHLLPTVAAPGSPLGVVDPGFAAAVGIGPDTSVRLGVTDATAAQIAAGAVRPGDAVTTIGTGLSIKAVSRARLRDDTGALYAHRHWDSGWIVSGTSHCGGDSISHHFPGQDWDALTAARHTPSSLLVLPLATVGEYFPFRAPQARGFEVGAPKDDADRFRGYLEGVAHVERLSLDLMAEAGAAVTGPQLTMGGGSANDTWMVVRASILGRQSARPAATSSAFGAAVVAAAIDGDITGAAQRMVRRAATFDPDPHLAEQAAQSHERFLAELTNRGYL